MIQKKEDLDQWYINDDPWNFELDKDDLHRKNVLISSIPDRNYTNVLDIGCGNGFITRELKGQRIIGIDLSSNAIKQAQKYSTDKMNFIQCNLFELNDLLKYQFDLIIITGVLYPQYIGSSVNLVYKIIDKLLMLNGILICVHIDEWYYSKFPYLLVDKYYYKYREFTHNLEIYIK